MDWKVVVLLVHLCAIIVPSSQDDYDDPFAETKKCNNGKGTCIGRTMNCTRVTNDEICGTGYLICCSEGEDNDIDFSTPPPSETSSTSTTTTATTTTTTTTTTTPATTTEDLSDYIPPDCGIGKSSRNYNTAPLDDAERQEFPWNVGIYNQELHPIFNNMMTVFLCGGTLIDDFVVLTAASCVYGKNKSSLVVFAGLWNTSNAEEGGRQIRNVQDIVIHNKFKESSKVNDIAFIFMDDKIDWSPTINRICLPEPGVEFEDSNCLVTGWGSTTDNKNKARSMLKSAEIRLIPATECEQQMKRVTYQKRFTLDQSFIGAVDEEYIVSRMDNGSPIICASPEGKTRQFYQAGIFSWKYSGSAPGIYTNIAMFRGWIDNLMDRFRRHSDIYTPQDDEENEDTD